ncbi:dihydroxyacetone kinase [Pyronema omphalodes]|nr:dihydroxyacetone kinase [Pyronema omphalodes]
MSSKHFVNSSSASGLTVGNCHGVAAAHPGLCVSDKEKVVFRLQNPKKEKVTLLSGGGSGHEPAHAGYVGDGMLDAAVCGDIFASPTALQIGAGLAAIQSSKGTLVIVKNYTGDRLNFALAVERSRAQGHEIETVTVADDVAVGREKGSLVGRRGLAGTALVHKVAGSAAESGEDLKTVTATAQHVIDNLATVGASLGRCHVPGHEESTEDALKPDELEIGMGIHNEPGCRRVSPIPSHEQLISDLLKMLLDTSDTDRGFIQRKPGEKVVLLVNNLGGISNLEINILTAETVHQLSSTWKITPCRVFAGSFMTSLNAPGFSITLLTLPEDAAISPDKILQHLDAPTTAVGWTNSLPASHWGNQRPVPPRTLSAATRSAAENLAVVPTNTALTSAILKAVLDSVTKNEPTMTEYDTLVGDGDCGTTLLSGAQALIDRNVTSSNLLQSSLDIANVIETSMGGTSGALYGIFFSAFARGLAERCQGSASFEKIAESAKYALETLEKYTPARKGDRTLMDALIPFVDRIYQDRKKGAEQALMMAVEDAKVGYKATKEMKARLGRASYVEDMHTQGEEAVPDPGALGVVAVVEGVLEAVQKAK